MPTGVLHIVAVPIGDPRDITLRALDVLRAVDAVIIEEYRAGSTLLKQLGVENGVLLLNEHNERAAAGDIIEGLRAGKSYALISDAGTPVFADPGARLIELAVGAGARVTPVPGPSSLMAALSLADFKVERFMYGGFLPRDAGQRRRALQTLRGLGVPVALMDAPYRLAALLADVAAVFGPERPVLLACDLTLPEEQVYRGPVGVVRAQVGARKSEFVLIVKGA